MRSIQAIVLVAALVLVPAAAVLAQSGQHTVHSGTGRVLAKSGKTLIIDVTEGDPLGPRKFTITEDMGIKFYKSGQEVTVLDLNVGNIVSAYRTETVAPSSVTITYDEVEEHKAAAPAPAPAPKPAPKPAPAPAALPSTGSALPLILTLGVAFLILGLSLTVLRRL